MNYDPIWDYETVLTFFKKMIFISIYGVPKIELDLKTTIKGIFAKYPFHIIFMSKGIFWTIYITKILFPILFLEQI